jgi:ectoine hydroxylase-related dioxygenase (phytanoyl-CoA dioxygenase family)
MISKNFMNIQISEHTYKNLNDNGYVIFRAAIDDVTVQRLKLDLERMKHYQMRSTTNQSLIDSMLYLNPHSNSKTFLDIICSEDLIALVKPLLNDPFYKCIPDDLPNYCLNFSICRSSGHDALDWHRDDRNPPSTHADPCYIQLGLALDKADESNGCTLIVPKSHRLDQYVNNINSHEKVPLILNPGDLVVYDGRLWHSAQPNLSNKSRLIFFFAFARWHLRQTYDFPNNICFDLLKSLSLTQKLLLGFHATTKINSDNDIAAGQRGDLKYLEDKYQEILHQKIKSIM